MLYNFGVRNFFSFKEGVEVSFELSSNCPKSISKGKRISNILCVRGANASGKTTILRVLTFLGSFCTESFNYAPDKGLPVSSFFSSSEPIDFFCEFLLDGVKYKYELSITPEKILEESLTRTVKRPSLLFLRKERTFEECIQEFEELKQIQIRANASVISIAHQYGLSILSPIYQFFKQIITNLAPYGRQSLQHMYQEVSEFYHMFPRSLSFASKMIKKFDVGIKNIKIDKITLHSEDEVLYRPVFTHDVDTQRNELGWEAQSSGTKELFSILPLYHAALTSGGLLVLDEFDTCLHSHLLPELVKLFDNKDTNPKNTQLFFSTHHDSVLDYMGKYRTLLVNKEHGESYAYRLDEIPGDLLRNDRPITSIYNAGKLGGVPNL